MKIKQIVDYPIKRLNRTWLGDLAKLVRIAYTPIKGTKKDKFVPSFRQPNLLEAKAGMKRTTTAKRLRELKKKVLDFDFRP